MHCRCLKIGFLRDSTSRRIPVRGIFWIGMTLLCVTALVDYLVGLHWKLLVAAPICITGICLLWFAAKFEWLWRYRKRYWERAEGSVVGKTSGGPESSFPKISFRVGDRNVVFVSRYNDEHVEIGRTSDVYYCSDCYTAEEYPRHGRLTYTAFFGFIGLMLVWMGITMLLQ